MEAWTAWKILKIFTAAGAMLLLGVSLVMLWRMRGILNWKRSLRQEFKQFKAAAGQAQAVRGQAMAVVIETCERVWQTSTPEFGKLMDLRGYIRSIAVCFHPQAEEPELRLTIGRFLMVLRETVDRLELILKRPGSSRLQTLRIRHIRQAADWYGRISGKWVFRKVQRYREAIRRIYQLYLVVLPDPFSWLVYFSNRLTILQLTRYLMLDVYLFAGKLAVEAYDASGDAGVHFSPSELEQTLEMLDGMESFESLQTDPRIRQIRNQLVGFGPFLLSTPGPKDWRKALVAAAEVIAGRYFPDAENPLEEAAVGPLLQRCQAWIRRLIEAETFPVIKHLYRIQLETLRDMKTFSGSILPEQFWGIAKKTWQAYHWMRWPLRAYRWFKMTSPLKVATSAGFLLIRKGLVNFVLRYTFDGACKELEILYRQSRGPSIDSSIGVLQDSVSVKPP